jgi:hypothetical protein
MPAQEGQKYKRAASVVTHRLAKVQTLELDYNEIEKVEGETFQFPDLEVLDLSYNSVSTITNAGVFLPRLRVLILKKNKLKNLRWLRSSARLPLAHLDMTGNLLATLSDCAELVNLEHLDTLDLTGNPLDTDLTLEAFCMLACGKLMHLNGQVVTDTARSRGSKWCEETDAGFQVKEYVNELQAYYKKQAASATQASRTSKRDHRFDDDDKRDDLIARERRKMSDKRAVTDPTGYLKHAKIALKQLTDAARARGHISIDSPLVSVISMREFEGHCGPRTKLMEWKRWSQEMKRYARRINDAQDRLHTGNISK